MKNQPNALTAFLVVAIFFISVLLFVATGLWVASYFTKNENVADINIVSIKPKHVDDDIRFITDTSPIGDSASIYKDIFATTAIDTMRTYHHQQAKINYWLWFDKKVPYDSVVKYQKLEEAD